MIKKDSNQDLKDRKEKFSNLWSIIVNYARMQKIPEFLEHHESIYNLLNELKPECLPEIHQKNLSLKIFVANNTFEIMQIGLFIEYLIIIFKLKDIPGFAIFKKNLLNKTQLIDTFFEAKMVFHCMKHYGVTAIKLSPEVLNSRNDTKYPDFCFRYKVIPPKKRGIHK